MSDRKFKVWLDSGANVESCRRTFITLSEIGITSERWDAMSDDEKDAAMREVAFEQSDWGFAEVTDDEDE